MEGSGKIRVESSKRQGTANRQKTKVERLLPDVDSRSLPWNSPLFAQGNAGKRKGGTGCRSVTSRDRRRSPVNEIVSPLGGIHGRSESGRKKTRSTEIGRGTIEQP